MGEAQGQEPSGGHGGRSGTGEVLRELDLVSKTSFSQHQAVADIFERLNSDLARLGIIMAEIAFKFDKILDSCKTALISISDSLELYILANHKTSR